jgi:cellulose synthase (UDP-forming)
MGRVLATVLWLTAAAMVVFLITQPINLQAHLIVGVIVVVVITLIKIANPRGPWRHIFLALGTAIVLRYVYWRTTSTLPPMNQPENLIPGLVLYIAEMYSVAMLGLSLFTVSDPLDRPSPPRLPASQLPTVDVYVPTYNEEKGILAVTLAAARAMDYPPDKLNVFLLDDGGTDQKCNSADPSAAIAAQRRRAELQELCRGLGATYLTRARNEHAKAGNLNAAFARTHGDLVAVFDADHAPTRDFLTETVGFFHTDPRLFLVQTPHFFINPDPLEHNLETFERMPSENEQFYGVVQRGLDKWNAAFFCGSAAVLRRSALEITHGFSGVSITEDCETALELHARGWNSVYVARPLIAGLQPETFASFIGQRSRWAQGMIQILILKNPLIKRGLTMAQRLCYMSSPMFWFFPFARLIFLFSPLLYLFFGLQIFDASGGEFAAYTSTYMIVNLMIQNYLYGKYRWPWISELYEYIQSIYLFRAIVSAIANPHKPTFKVTTKGETLDESQISELGWPFYITFVLLVGGVAMTAWRIAAEPYTADITMVVGGWNVFNLIMAGAALGVVSERRNLRRAPRVELNRGGELIVGDVVMPAVIEDGSMGGVRVRPVGAAAEGLKVGETVVLRFEPHAELPTNELALVVRAIARDAEGIHLGCQPTLDTPMHYRLIADLVYADSGQWTRFQMSRRKGVGVLKGTLIYLWWAGFQTLRGASYLLTGRREARGAVSAVRRKPA